MVARLKKLGLVFRKQDIHFWSNWYSNLFVTSAQGTSASCPFDQQLNMLQPTTEYFIKMCLFCCHDQQQNAANFYYAVIRASYLSFPWPQFSSAPMGLFKSRAIYRPYQMHQAMKCDTM